MILLGSFATVAVVLACVGLYGTLSYLVNSRRREVGLRLALGAFRSQIVGGFLTQGLAVAALACVAGLALAALSARWLSGILYGVSPFDPLTFAAVALIVLTSAVIAAVVPSARAAQVQPMQVLKLE